MLVQICFSQVGIGNNSPKATLDVNKATYSSGEQAGIAVTQLTAAQILAMNTSGLKAGTLVYATTSTGIINTVGYWYYNGSAWQEIANYNNFLSAFAVLTQVGNEADNPNILNSVVTYNQLMLIPGLSNHNSSNESLYQDYIDDYPDKFSSPATVSQIQNMFYAVFYSQAALAQIGSEGDSPNTVPSVISVTQLNYIIGITGINDLNLTHYREYIDSYPNNFSTPATVAEVQAMITAVNASQNILIQIGNEGDNPNVFPSLVTMSQLRQLQGITNLDDAYELQYRSYIDIYPDRFSSPATITEVNRMSGDVFITNYLLIDIGNGDDFPVLLLNEMVGLSNVDLDNELEYNEYVQSNPDSFSSPATIAEVQAMVNAVNASKSALIQIGNEGDSPNVT
ncbi:MAG: hypothetical protein KA210_03460, partial [Bacteroidia bacterium]|nr:hypothetical protein [Bacteroidia bacterium]